jgi:thiol:disulfide interchange protein DsbD
MTVYGLAIAVPFVFLALSPRALASLPRAGAWMNEVKVAGGLIELAAALKFLVIADHAWGWGVFGRTSILVLWSAVALILALYLLGLVRWDGDSRIERVGLSRLGLALAFLALGIWFAAGVSGLELGAVEGLFPGS